jgi:hypothetical protein
MTFLEAAIEVLKREGKPLHTRQLAIKARELNLLSVVGRDPEGTMEQRLKDAMEKPDPRLGLIAIRDGMYGLVSYPPQPYPARAEAPAAKAEAGEANGGDGEAAEARSGEQPAGEQPAGEKKGRRRRGRRGRGKRGGEGAAAKAGAEPGGEAEVASDEEGADEAEAEAPSAEAAPAAGAKADGGERRGRRRSRRGGRGRRRGEKPAAESAEATEAVDTAEGETETAAEDVTADLPERVTPEDEVAAAVEASDEVAETMAARQEGAGEPSEAAVEGADSELLIEEGAEAEAPDEEGGLDEEFDLPSGPLLAPSSGAEESTRGDEDRTLRPEIQGRRIGDDRPSRHRRGRDRDRGRGRGGEREARNGQQPAQQGQPQQQRPQQQQPQQPPREPGREPIREIDRPGPPSTVSAGGSAIDAVVEVLRGSDGRPMHVRQLADLMLKRHLVDGKLGHGEVVRQLRAALVREARDREADGLRARVRALGGGHYALADRKLDQELVPIERELADKAQRLREATQNAVRRRIQRLPPPAFEALGRALADKLGITGVELVRRGDGVAYYGGQKTLGVASVKTLIAMRPGEAEVGRRAVGELRAGLAARGYDEGLLLAGGRAAQDGLTELKAGTGVVVHDGQSLAGLCIQKGLGVRRVHLPIDYLDLELFSELTET